MAVSVSTVISSCRDILQDDNGVRWSDEELLRWLNDAVAEICLIVPTCNVKTIEAPLVGGTQQTFNNVIRVLDVVRNLDGSVVTRVDRSAFDISYPGWVQEEENAKVIHFMYDDDVADTCHVYPPQPDATPGTVILKAKYRPSVITATSEGWPIESELSPAAVEYILYKAFSKEADYASGGRANYHKANFAAEVSPKAGINADAVVKLMGDAYARKG